VEINHLSSRTSVPQDSVLDSTIFNCCISDLPSTIKSGLEIHTDDCTMFSIIRNSSDTEAVHVQMQQDLDNIQAWADKSQITFVPHKCQTMTITKTGRFNGITIAESPTIIILRLPLTRN